MAILRSCAKLLVLIWLTWQFSATGWAQNYPAKIVRYVVTDSPGGLADALGRIVAAGLTEVFGQQVIVAIREATVAALKRTEVSKRMQDIVLAPVGDQPEVFTRFVKSEIEKWGKIIRATGLTAN